MKGINKTNVNTLLNLVNVGCIHNVCRKLKLKYEWNHSNYLCSFPSLIPFHTSPESHLWDIVHFVSQAIDFVLCTLLFPFELQVSRVRASLRGNVTSGVQIKCVPACREWNRVVTSTLTHVCVCVRGHNEKPQAAGLVISIISLWREGRSSKCTSVSYPEQEDRLSLSASTSVLVSLRLSLTESFQKGVMDIFSHLLSWNHH